MSKRNLLLVMVSSLCPFMGERIGLSKILPSLVYKYSLQGNTLLFLVQAKFENNILYIAQCRLLQIIGLRVSILFQWLLSSRLSQTHFRKYMVELIAKWPWL